MESANLNPTSLPGKRSLNADASVPCEPERSLLPRSDDANESDPNNRDILDKTGTITEHVNRVVFPAFSLERGDGCEIHENTYWSLQTYLRFRENLAANEGARSFIHESTRERTPLRHAHCDHIRALSIEQIREMYRQVTGTSSTRAQRQRSSSAQASSPSTSLRLTPSRAIERLTPIQFDLQIIDWEVPIV